jgi:hypothetical protein
MLQHKVQMPLSLKLPIAPELYCNLVACEASTRLADGQKIDSIVRKQLSDAHWASRGHAAAVLESYETSAS